MATGVDPEESLDQLLLDLGSTRGGLTTREAQRRLLQHGPNEIEHRREASRWRELAQQFTHPLALTLRGAKVRTLTGSAESGRLGRSHDPKVAGSDPAPLSTDGLQDSMSCASVKPARTSRR